MNFTNIMLALLPVFSISRTREWENKARDTKQMNVIPTGLIQTDAQRIGTDI